MPPNTSCILLLKNFEPSSQARGHWLCLDVVWAPKVPLRPHCRLAIESSTGRASSHSLRYCSVYIPCTHACTHTHKDTCRCTHAHMHARSCIMEYIRTHSSVPSCFLLLADYGNTECYSYTGHRVSILVVRESVFLTCPAHTHTHTHTHAHTQTHTHTHTHTHRYERRWWCWHHDWRHCTCSSCSGNCTFEYLSDGVNSLYICEV